LKASTVFDGATRGLTNCEKLQSGGMKLEVALRASETMRTTAERAAKLREI
jgi:hypothetical protein